LIGNCFTEKSKLLGVSEELVVGEVIGVVVVTDEDIVGI
jgi:hypothetical protein